MLSGLSVLLGNNIIGYETDINDSIVRTWEIKNGNFIIGGYQATNISTKLRPKFQSIPIVVLIGPVSKSSGSMMAIAFKEDPIHTLLESQQQMDIQHRMDIFSLPQI